MNRQPPRSTRICTLVPYSTLLRSGSGLASGICPLAFPDSERFYSADIPAGTPFSKVCRVYRFRHVRILPPIPICALCARSDEHTSELQSLMRTSYAVFCLQQKLTFITSHNLHITTYLPLLHI